VSLQGRGGGLSLSAAPLPDSPADNLANAMVKPISLRKASMRHTCAEISLRDFGWALFSDE
jgi:hypothetical protein